MGTENEIPWRNLTYHMYGNRITLTLNQISARLNSTKLPLYVTYIAAIALKLQTMATYLATLHCNHQIWCDVNQFCCHIICIKFKHHPKVRFGATTRYSSTSIILEWNNCATLKAIAHNAIAQQILYLVMYLDTANM